MSGPPPTAAPSRRRRHVIAVVKVVAGLAILGLIVTKLDLQDRVRLEAGDEVLEGSDLRFDRSTSFLVVEREDGRTVRIPLAEDPTVLRSGTRWRLRHGNGMVELAGPPRYEGSLEITVDGAPRTLPLSEVAHQERPTEGGATELILDVREGLVTIYGRLSILRYAAAMILLLLSYVFGILRWKILLGAQGLVVRYWEAFRLTFIGFFFNNIVPGLTGGDVVKAVMIARAHPGHGPDAVSTVIVDRVLGLIVLALLSAAVLVFTFDRYQTVAIWLFAMLAVSGLLIALFLSRRVRRRIRLDRLLGRLPGADVLRRLDQAFMLYRSRGREVAAAVGLSVVAHLMNILSVYLMGMDLGVDRSAGLEGTPVVTYLATVPTILIASSVPLLPGGWGLGEAVYAYFFRTVGIRNLSLSVGLSVLTRASALLWSLVGGIFFLLHRRETEAAFHEAEDLPPGYALPEAGGS